MILLVVFVIDFIFNIPFGYWRASEKTFSLNWFLSIHIPIPFIIFLRIFSDIGFALYTYPILVFSFFTGQFLGKYIFKWRVKNELSVSKCICTDLFERIYTQTK